MIAIDIVVGLEVVDIDISESEGTFFFRAMVHLGFDAGTSRKMRDGVAPDLPLTAKQDAFESRFEFEYVKRLHDVIIGAGPKAFEAFLKFASGTDHDDGNQTGARVVAKEPAKPEAVHVGHED